MNALHVVKQASKKQLDNCQVVVMQAILHKHHAVCMVKVGALSCHN
jgi:hypothetical protein